MRHKRAPRIQFNCDYCGKPSSSKQSVYKRKIKHFCSRNCYSLYRKEVMKPYEQNNWKGQVVGYRALHHWVESQLGKASKCSNDKGHISTRYHWANISGEYKRDLEDWKELCPKCNLSDGVSMHERFKGGLTL